MSIQSLTAAEIDYAARRSAGSASWLQCFARELRRALRAHSPLIVVILLHIAGAAIAPAAFGLPEGFAPGLYVHPMLALTFMFVALAATAYVARVTLVIRPDRLAHHLWADIRGRFVTTERICMALPLFLLIPPFMSAFTYFKMVIPAIQPFVWDPAFAAADRVLHGGHQPWELLHGMLADPHVTSAIAFIYQRLWVFVLYAVMLWQLVSVARPRLRMQYMITLVLLWIVLGNVAAILLSSAGPVYYGRITGLPDPFAPLMGYLHAANETAPIVALDMQDMLWRSYLTAGAEIGRGISAMPSLHIATSFSFVLIGFATSRRLGILLGVFLAIMLVGSVHLGWHYALDGYVAILATWAVWKAVGWTLDRPLVTRWLWGENAPAG